ncbi:MAG: hypothetical protein ACE5I2_03785 [Anaerolineae bacterium]
MLAMTETSDWLIFWVVAAARFLLPLTIPRYPLPGIVASLVLDGVDQTIFQQFTSLPLEGYQGYDKALDIYYLTIAYISTLRNWVNRFAFQVSRFLFYWRLMGVALFELTHLRLLLLIFPNTFEYLFIFYEAYRLRWDPKRMTKKLLIGAAAFIWMVIKLPQEYWLHIAQADVTDWIKTNLFGAPTDRPWSEIFQTWPGTFLAVFAVAALVLVAAWWLARRRLPPADRALAFSADAHQPTFTAEQVRSAVASEASRIVDAALVEKIVLITLVSISFAQVLPDMQSSNLQLVIGVALVVTINTALSHWLARRGFGWAFALRQFMVMTVVNLGLIVAYAWLRSGFDASVSIGNVLFFALLLTLLVTLFDHYRQVYLMRFGPQRLAEELRRTWPADLSTQDVIDSIRR